MTGTERPKVHSFAIELTAQCNQRCRYCYNDPERRATGETANPDRLLARVRRLLTTFEVDHLTLTGGEPFLWEGLWQLLDLLQAHHRGAQIISNGGLVTSTLAKRLASYQPRYVQITLNGPTAKRHAEHCGQQEHFGHTVDGIRRLQDHGVSVVGCTVVTHRNATAMAEILELFHSLDVDHIALSRFSPAGRAVQHAAQFLPTRGDMITAFEQAQPFARDRAMSLHSTMPIPPCVMDVECYAPIQFGSCSIGTDMQEFALSPSGALRNCPLHRTAIGEVTDINDPQIDLPALLGNKQVTGYRENYPEFCDGCLYATNCGGGCGAAADWLLGYEQRRQPDPFLWQHIDDEFAERLGRAEPEQSPSEVNP